MSRSQWLYLNDIIEAVEHIQSYRGELSFEEFRCDQMRIDAIIRNFEIIGEAVKNLSDDVKKQFLATDCKAVA